MSVDIKTLPFLAVLFLASSSRAMSDRIDEASPDGRYVASAFLLNSGATTDYRPEVELRLSGSQSESEAMCSEAIPAAPMSFGHPTPISRFFAIRSQELI
jgi:hypothetical protein